MDYTLVLGLSKQAQNVSLGALSIKYSMRTEGISTHLIGAGNSEILKKNLIAATKVSTDRELKLMKELQEKYEQYSFFGGRNNLTFNMNA